MLNLSSKKAKQKQPQYNNSNAPERSMKKILAATLLVTFVMTGCNTIKGVGKDVSSVGEAVSSTATQTSDKISK